MIASSNERDGPLSLWREPEIKRPRSLKGKKIGISRFGSSTDFGLRYAEERPGRSNASVISPSFRVGGVTDVFNALQGRRRWMQAVVNAELAILARREGTGNLVDIWKLGI